MGSKRLPRSVLVSFRWGQALRPGQKVAMPNSPRWPGAVKFALAQIEVLNEMVAPIKPDLVRFSRHQRNDDSAVCSSNPNARRVLTLDSDRKMNDRNFSV
jgi:hypothetical protein